MPRINIPSGELNLEVALAGVGVQTPLFSLPLVMGQGIQLNIGVDLMGVTEVEKYQFGNVAVHLAFLEIGSAQSFGTYETDIDKIHLDIWDKLVTKVQGTIPSAAITLENDPAAKSAPSIADTNFLYDPSKYGQRIVNPEQVVPFLYQNHQWAGHLSGSASRGATAGKVNYEWHWQDSTPEFFPMRPGYLFGLLEIPPNIVPGDFVVANRNLLGTRWDSLRDIFNPIYAMTNQEVMLPRHAIDVADTDGQTIRARLQILNKQIIPGIGAAQAEGASNSDLTTSNTKIVAEAVRKVWRQSAVTGRISGSFHYMSKGG